MTPRFYDAHNHFHDERLVFCGAATGAGAAKMVVNGSKESDWPEVLAVARRWPLVVPSFGYHPWHVAQRTPDWLNELARCLDTIPSAVGEIGLDRWIDGHDLPEQERVFLPQLHAAAERGIPATIHCLKAWGRLLELLQSHPLPKCGFLLHSYSGPREMIEPLAELGGYFSISGYFAHERKHRQREVFRHVPADRFLIETDAPDQHLPPDRIEYPRIDPSSGDAINHPANLAAVYRFAAELRDEPIEILAEKVERNFYRLFGGLCEDSERRVFGGV